MAGSSICSSASRVAQTNDEDSIDTIVTINEKVSLTKQQHQRPTLSLTKSSKSR